ncbi:MAG TPA: nitrate ABC transporter substrate-binding protein [Streptosporangiaceae bacterium]|nr:nitrate ABC transporter substrate-binding protein [Streptosporangiaceae bacterium]
MNDRIAARIRLRAKGRPFGRALCAAVAVALGLALVGCSDSGAADGAGGSGHAEGQRVTRSAPATSLAGVCPATIVFQDDWWPQAETAALYRLLGEDVRVDKAKKRVSAPLVSDGADTGVRIELRAGGPANGFTRAAKILYLDKEVMLGSADIDLAAAASNGAQPVLPVFAPMDISPLVLMWDPRAHPEWKSIADIGKTGARVLYFPGSTYMQYLVDAGILRKSQVEDSYDGTPARFVAERGKVAQQGYLTNEVFQFEHELPQWKRKVAWQLVSDAGYPNYPAAVAIRPDRKAALAPCLEKLVPIMQRSAVAYAADPAPTNALIVQLVKDYGAFPYSPERAAAAVATMKRYGIIGNGANKTVGDFDTARVQKIIDILRPLLAAEKRPLKAGLRPDDIATNAFIDPRIGLPS